MPNTIEGSLRVTEFETIAAQAKASYASGWDHGVKAEKRRLHALLEKIHGRIDPESFPEIADAVSYELDGCEDCATDAPDKA